MEKENERKRQSRGLREKKEAGKEIVLVTYIMQKEDPVFLWEGIPLPY